MNVFSPKVIHGPNERILRNQIWICEKSILGGDFETSRLFFRKKEDFWINFCQKASSFYQKNQLVLMKKISHLRSWFWVCEKYFDQNNLTFFPKKSANFLRKKTETFDENRCHENVTFRGPPFHFESYNSRSLWNVIFFFSLYECRPANS